ncbi:gamma-glutamyltranspeptidase [Thiosulfatimonas sediminis]|uniref:Glutathione hydrolase proenzyme n=1 Tax=Thiosulfatimonas sediminis TaxID=2675054 RepID=A0A6F8PWT5_9GAMM|nr:gamma-glutamyltransferase [Thiosulfatimonas sediminis]BBP46585.1 gamma-glutamyltranspeptidase [Thiosulfatimonas sediminis]
MLLKNKLFSIRRYFLLVALCSASAQAQILQAVPSQLQADVAVQTIQTAQFNGAYAMPDEFSAQVVETVFAKGGNAIDAAVAAGFMLAVTFPEAGNLGGGGFMTLAFGSGEVKQAAFLDYREMAPKAALSDLYLDDKGEVIPYKSLVGYAASGVPGTVMGLWQAHQKFGTLPWAELLQPAIDKASHGFVVPDALEKSAQWYQNWVADKSVQPLNFSQYFSGLQSGKVFKQTQLASTLTRIAKQGAVEFYQGKTAQLLAAQYQKNGGLITQDDLNNYQAKWRTPVKVDWFAQQIVSAPPPSSGGIAIAQLLKMYQFLEPQYRAALADAELAGVPKQAVQAHFYAELAKRVFADRAKHLGDSDFYPVPVASLIENRYLRERAEQVNFQAISSTENIQPGKFESPETTHFSIIDPYGNAVANTYTLNMPFGNGVVIEGAGFLMNNEMDDFSTKPGVANLFGVVGGSANQVAPQKRMLSSMSPTLVLQDGKVQTVLGSPGGSTIISSVFQTLINLYREEMNAQQAVNAPRVHHQLLPKDVIVYHPELADDVKQELSLLGYQLKRHNYLGDVQLLWHSEDGWQAAADMRGRGVAKVLTKNAAILR